MWPKASAYSAPGSRAIPTERGLSHKPGLTGLFRLDQHVNIHRPHVSSARIAGHQTLKHGPSSASVSVSELALSKLRDGFHIYGTRCVCVCVCVCFSVRREGGIEADTVAGGHLRCCLRGSVLRQRCRRRRAASSFPLLIRN